MIDKTNIDIIDNSLKSYLDDINDKGNFSSTSDYNGVIEPNMDELNEAKTYISDFLKQLKYTQMPLQNDIKNMNLSYNNFYNDLQESNEINGQLKNLVSKYERNNVMLENAQKTKTYTLLMVWIVILMFIGSALFFSVIEDKKDMNIFSKAILCLFSLVVFFYVVKNLL